MIVAYIGNFVPEHSTENHVRQAWENQGHTVIRVQEGEPEQLRKLIERIQDVDLVLWTRTANLAADNGHKLQWELLTAAKRAYVPTVAFHLDRWWGLGRESAVWDEPFFRCQYVVTADGGHDKDFERIGVNHHWMPPAVALGETELGEAQPQYRSPIAFVGSWQPGYHPEWKHRAELVSWLQRKYRSARFWPQPGQQAIRGESLRNLYASTDVVIGDSCLVGGAERYWSDRIPETIGRGGFLIHPYVKGIEDHFTLGEHLITWTVGDWPSLKREIDRALVDVDWRKEIARRGREHVIANHTYDVRVNQILELVRR